MELRHLRYFVAVAEEMSFTRAAQRLHIAQPPLSQQIRDLETELGVLLFNRTKRSIMLTQAGKEFLPEAREILDSVARLQQRAVLRARGDLGRLTIGIISSMAVTKFAGMLRSFQKNNPGIQISLTDHPSSWQLEALTAGKIDVGFLRPPTEPPPLIKIRRLQREPMKLAVPSDHPFAVRKEVDWKDLSAEPIILVEPGITGPGYYDGFFRHCRSAGFEPLVQQYTMNVATQVWLVSAGLGIAPMVIAVDIDRLAGISLVGLPKNAPIYETAMAWRESDTSAALRRFVDFVDSWMHPH